MRKQKGFTLIELLVVIAIIGLLSTLAVISLNNARAKSRDAKRISDIKQLQTALEMYFNQNNTYPVMSGQLAIGALSGSNNWILCSSKASAVAGYSGFETGTACASTADSLYMKIPTASTPVDSTTCADHNTYSYTGAASMYRLKYCLGAKTGDIGVGINTAYEQGISGGL